MTSSKNREGQLTPERPLFGWQRNAKLTECPTPRPHEVMHGNVMLLGPCLKISPFLPPRLSPWHSGTWIQCSHPPSLCPHEGHCCVAGLCGHSTRCRMPASPGLPGEAPRDSSPTLKPQKHQYFSWCLPQTPKNFFIFIFSFSNTSQTFLAAERLCDCSIWTSHSQCFPLEETTPTH